MLVLASTSPQRRSILQQLQIPFEVIPPAYEETTVAGETPSALVRLHAQGKARSVHRSGRVTLGVDTAVCRGDRVYGKPADATDAERMLRELSGAEHTVLSGVCLLGPSFEAVEHALTTVTFRNLTDAELDTYLAAGEWRGRAGAYAIQGRGSRLVARIDGDYLNVVGLPGALLLSLLERFAPSLLEMW